MSFSLKSVLHHQKRKAAGADDMVKSKKRTEQTGQKESSLRGSNT